MSTKYSTEGITRLLELTFINKSLAHKAEISPDQTHPTVGDMPNCPNNEDPKFEILVDKFTK